MHRSGGGAALCAKTLTFIMFAALGTVLPAVSLNAAEWVLGAEAFTHDKGASHAAVAAANDIPKIMLDYFSSGIERVILPDELDARHLRDLLTRRQALFLELSAAVKKRDGTLFESDSARKKSLKTEEAAVAAIKEKINANIGETKKLLEGAEGLSGSHNETIALWKNDDTLLFEFPEGKTRTEVLNAEKINGFISGKVHVLDDYAAVTAVLTVYPGGREQAVVTDIGRLSDTADIARRLALALVPRVMQTLPITISFEIEPESARTSSIVYIDEVVFTSIPNEITLQGGIHTLGIEARGYKTELFTVSFEGNKSYVVHAQMREQLLDSITLSLKREIDGSFFINSFEVSPEEETNAIIIEAKDSTVFGQFAHADGNSSYFYIPAYKPKRGLFTQFLKNVPEEQSEPSGIVTRNAVINPKSVDVVKRIETSRKIMYASYAAAMVSLPVLFYSIGEYTQYSNGSVLAYNRGDMESSASLKADAEKWQTINNISIGVTSALAVNFVVQLIIYLVQANKALPEEAKIP